MESSIFTILIIALIGTFAFADGEKSSRFTISATLSQG